jgi:membrane protein required for colicin V production
VNRIDVILAIVLAFFVIRGFWRGFSREFFGFIGLLGGLVVAAAAYGTVAASLPEAIPHGARPIVAFAVLFFAVNLAANLLGALVHHLLGLVFLSPVNRIAGAAFGAAKGAALLLVALLLVRAYVPMPALIGALERSRLARPLLAMAEEAEHQRSPASADDQRDGEAP